MHIYMPMTQYARSWGIGLVLKLRGDPHTMGDRVRAELQRVVPGSSYLVAAPLADELTDAQASWRMGAAVLVWFGVLALVVAAIGLYGTVSYDITQRANEWAIRIALGADRRRILSLIAGRSMRVVVLGIIPGIAMSAALGRWLQPLLFETAAINLPVYAFVALLLGLTAFSAVLVPAFTASRTEPSAKLRDT
jgi:predicted lysophospholipase L1 biosynthesis ABC-type transport system permease subunit